MSCWLSPTAPETSKQELWKVICRELQLPADRTNPNGSGISLDHPIGATGAILTVKALYELARTGGRRAPVTMCSAAVNWIAAIFD